jgi:hypothetical protein
VRRMLVFVAAFLTLGLYARAELFVVKMDLRVKVVNASTGNLSNVTVTVTNIIEACGEDPETSTLVLDSEAPGAMSIVDNETGDDLVDFVEDTTTDRNCAINGIGTKFYCQAFFELFNGDGGSAGNASAVGPIDRRIDSASGSVIRYNWTAKIQGNLDNETFGLPGVSAPFYGTFSSPKRFVPTTAPPCSAPTAATTAASNVGTTSATLNANVNPNGRSTQAAFQYGLTATYGNSMSASSPGSGTSDTSVTANLSDLLPGQTYHYRVTASSTCGSVLGSDMTFTTSTLTNSLATSSLAK